MVDSGLTTHRIT